MVWEFQLTTIVMLTRCVEDGKVSAVKYLFIKEYPLLFLLLMYSSKYCYYNILGKVCEVLA